MCVPVCNQKTSVYISTNQMPLQKGAYCLLIHFMSLEMSATSIESHTCREHYSTCFYSCDYSLLVFGGSFKTIWQKPHLVSLETVTPTTLPDRNNLHCTTYDRNALKLQYRTKLSVQQFTDSARCIQGMCTCSNYQSPTQDMLITQSSHLTEGKVCLASTPENQEDTQSGAFCVEQQ